MNIEDIKTKLTREPFRPFVIEFISGNQITVYGNSELLFPRRRPELVIAFTDDGMHEFEASAIAQLIEG